MFKNKSSNSAYKKKSTDDLTASLLSSSERETANLRPESPEAPRSSENNEKPASTLQQMRNDTTRTIAKTIWQTGISLLGIRPPISSTYIHETETSLTTSLSSKNNS